MIDITLNKYIFDSQKLFLYCIAYCKAFDDCCFQQK